MKRVTLAMLAAAVLLAAAPPAHAQWQVTSADGKSTLTVGFLSQLQAEALKNPDAGASQGNVFVRRFRAMVGGRINERLAIYADTDVPNAGKGGTTGAKTENGVILQDAALTYTLNPDLRVDAGLLLVPVSHNTQQSAGSLLTVDYGPYSFLHSDVTNSKVGRDYGAALRGFLGGRRVEYRAGVYQGSRDTTARGPMRVAGRLVYYAAGVDSGMFYLGTSLGKRQIVAVGASLDAQREYRAAGGDVVVEWPVPGGDGVTLQGDFIHYDGNTTFAKLPEQNATLVEAGWYLHQLNVTPFVQFAGRDYRLASLADETKLTGGIAWWGNGHKMNVKAAVARLTKKHASDGLQAVLQWQVLGF